MREKAARLERAAALHERGADGESETAEALSRLPRESWTVLHDVRWPGRRYANIDHIVVGPAGVFVIDSKKWSGDVSVRGGVLRQGRHVREDAVDGSRRAAGDVARLLLDLPSEFVHPVLSFSGRSQIEARIGEVLMCSTGNLVTMLLTRPHLMGARQSEAVVGQLRRALRPAGRPVRPRGSSGAPALALMRGLLAMGLGLGVLVVLTHLLPALIASSMSGHPAR